MKNLAQRLNTLALTVKRLIERFTDKRFKGVHPNLAALKRLIPLLLLETMPRLMLAQVNQQSLLFGMKMIVIGLKLVKLA